MSEYNLSYIMKEEILLELVKIREILLDLQLRVRQLETRNSIDIDLPAFFKSLREKGLLESDILELVNIK